VSRPRPSADLALAGLVAVILLAAALAALRPADRTLDQRARALDAEIRCPVCQGTSIADSPADFAVEMRAVIREQLAAGATDDQVRAFFVERYGVWILLSPPMAGPEIVVWVAPAAIVLGGVLVLALRSRRRAAAAAPRTVAPARLGRVPAAVVVGAIGLALALPIAIAVGPRGLGAEITGTLAAQPAAPPSLEELEAAAVRRPDDPAVLVALGDAYLAGERTVDAAAVYRRVLELAPGHETASLRLGVILLTAGRPVEATQLLDGVLARSPDQPDALLYRALAGYAQGAGPERVRADVLAFLAVAADDPRRPMAEQLLDLTNAKRSDAP
jgi:cytochrome c-type biogenesis protein CcmH/NrfF